MRKHTIATAPGMPSIDVPFTAQEEIDRDAEEAQAAIDAAKPQPPAKPTIDELDARLKILEGL